MRTTRREFIAQAVGGSILLAGCQPTGSSGGGGAQNGAEFRMGLVYFAPEEGADNCIGGLFEGLAEQGFERDANLEVLSAHAQGEIANIPLLLQNYDSQNLDLIVTLTTPCLTAASGIVKRTPVVFTYVYDPIAAGAGTSREDHLPNITGVGSFPPVEETIDLMQTLVPGLSAVGTVYNSSEANSVKVISVAREIFERRNIELEEVTAISTSEVFQAAQVVSYRDVQALWVTGDNTALQSFDAIVRASRDARIPLIINDPEFTPRGAVASVGLGWHEAGRAGGILAARVLRGEDPRDLPFEEVAVKKIVLNEDAARELGITFPPEVLAEANA
jgi:putative ABC transport system substrate-binding protein